MYRSGDEEMKWLWDGRIVNGREDVGSFEVSYHEFSGVRSDSEIVRVCRFRLIGENLQCVVIGSDGIEVGIHGE